LVGEDGFDGVDVDRFSLGAGFAAPNTPLGVSHREPQEACFFSSIASTCFIVFSAVVGRDEDSEDVPDLCADLGELPKERGESSYEYLLGELPRFPKNNGWLKL